MGWYDYYGSFTQFIVKLHETTGSAFKISNISLLEDTASNSAYAQVTFSTSVNAIYTLYKLTVFY